MAISKIKVGGVEHELQTTIGNVTDLQSTLDNKANKSHNHDTLYYTKTETDSAISQKAQVQIITWEDDD